MNGMRTKKKRLNAFMFRTCWNKETLFLNNAVNEMKIIIIKKDQLNVSS